jgi:hypothetical protein
MAPFSFYAVSILTLTLVTAHQAQAAEKQVYPDTINPVSEPVVVPDTNAYCVGVTCSGHGQCVVKDDNPVCACEEGYLPDDQTGLHCILTQHKWAAESVGYVEPKLPAYDYYSEPVTRRDQKHQYRRAAKLALQTHPEYMSLIRKRRLGLAGTIVGGITMGMGAMVSLFSSKSEATRNSGIVAGCGLALFIPSIIASGSARRKLNAIYKSELEKQQYGVYLSGVGAAVSQGGHQAALNATFKF